MSLPNCSELVFELVICHAIGDYVLQNDFLANTKGKNWYHLFIHSILYVVPFYFVLGAFHHVVLLFLSHFIIDAMKARYNMINYLEDQILHYCVAIIIYLGGYLV